jgi:hypothetical protein
MKFICLGYIEDKYCNMSAPRPRFASETAKPRSPTLLTQGV